MIEVKVNMTEEEINEAQRKNQARRRAALLAFKAGKKTSSDTCKVLKSCDNLHIMLERMRKKARR